MAWWQALLVGIGPALIAFYGVSRQIANTKDNLTKNITSSSRNVMDTIESNDQATHQREVAGRREEWWRRFAWAAELSLKVEDAHADAGLRVLEVLRRSPLARQSEKDIMSAFVDRKNQAMIDRVSSEVEKDRKLEQG